MRTREFDLFIIRIGPNTIEQVRDAVNSLIHCWVVKGTGRFADLMAALSKNPHMDILNDTSFRAIHIIPDKDKDKDKVFSELDEKEKERLKKEKEKEKEKVQRELEDKAAMYLAICRSPRLHVFDLETDPFEELIAELEKMKSVEFRGFRVLMGFLTQKSFLSFFTAHQVYETRGNIHIFGRK
jgi:hypothetical protein